MSENMTINASNAKTVIGTVTNISLVSVSSNINYPKVEPFLGRTTDINEIYQSILQARINGAFSWFNIYGESGVGKSTLAKMLCYHAQTQKVGRNFENILWLDINKDLGNSISSRITGLLTESDIKHISNIYSLIDFLNKKSYMVVLDGVTDPSLLNDLQKEGWNDIILVIISENNVMETYLETYSTEYQPDQQHFIKLTRFDIETSINLLKLIVKERSEIDEEWRILCEKIATVTLSEGSTQLECLPFDLVNEGRILELNSTMTPSQRASEINQITRIYREKAIETLLLSIGEKTKHENERNNWFDQSFRKLVSVLPTARFSKLFLEIFFERHRGKALRILDILRTESIFLGSSNIEDHKQFYLHQLHHERLYTSEGTVSDYIDHIKAYIQYTEKPECEYRLERENILGILKHIPSIILSDYDIITVNFIQFVIELTSKLLEKSSGDSSFGFIDKVICLDVRQELHRWKLENVRSSDAEKATLKQAIIGDLARLFGMLVQAGKFGDEKTPQTAMYYAQKRLEFVQDGDDMNQKSRATSNIGALFGMTNDTFKALSRHKEALELAEEHMKQHPETYGWIIGCYSNLVSDYQEIVYHWLRIRQALIHKDFTWLPENPAELFGLVIHQNLYLFNSQIEHQIEQFQFLITPLGQQIEDNYKKMCQYFEAHSELKEDGQAFENYNSGLNSYANYLVAKARLGRMDESLTEDEAKELLELLSKAHQLYRQVAQNNTSLGYAGLVYWCCVQEDVEQANYWLNYPEVADVAVQPQAETSTESSQEQKLPEEQTQEWKLPQGQTQEWKLPEEQTQEWKLPEEQTQEWKLPQGQTQPELKNVILNTDENTNLSLIAAFISDEDKDNLRPIVTERLPELIEIAQKKAQASAQKAFNLKKAHREAELQQAEAQYTYYLRHAQLYAELIITANRAMDEALNSSVE